MSQCSGTVKLAKLVNRRMRGKTLKEVANAAGISPTSLCLIRSGCRGISIKMAKKLAKGLNEDPANLSREIEELVLAGKGERNKLKFCYVRQSQVEFTIRVPLNLAKRVTDFVMEIEKEVNKEV
ncbi:MAG: helix-turn-helix transcriptional regulator [Parcubacteria group bacterium]|nr:helix-turn-helix transcriptional regulator [Parcubacteria group bacterium]